MIHAHWTAFLVLAAFGLGYGASWFHEQRRVAALMSEAGRAVAEIVRDPSSASRVLAELGLNPQVTTGYAADAQVAE